MFRNTLPFPRGFTWGDGQVTLDATSGSQLLGQVYEVPDSIHLTGKNVKLRVVKNDGSAITVARKGVSYGTAAGDFGRFVTGFNVTAGGYGQLIDDAFAVGKVIAANDLFYVVEEGPCNALSSSAASTLAAQCEVSFAAGGRLTTITGASTYYCIGKTDIACNTTSTTILIHVRPASRL